MRVSQNSYSIRFHTDKAKRHKYKRMSMIIRNEGSISDNDDNGGDNDDKSLPARA
jgi:hypothetical protein